MEAVSLQSLNQESRSTWACELKLCWPVKYTSKPWSRSTWACELKCKTHWTFPQAAKVTLHVSVWVEIKCIRALCSCFSSRSTWACELKSQNKVYALTIDGVTLHVSVWVEMGGQIGWWVRPGCHAPRERVSWNIPLNIKLHFKSVTLHVSVWVEIKGFTVVSNPEMSRSTWACELKLNQNNHS